VAVTGCGTQVSDQGSRSLEFGAVGKDLPPSAVLIKVDPSGKQRFIPRQIQAGTDISKIVFENATSTPHGLVLRARGRGVVARSGIIREMAVDIPINELRAGRYTYTSITAESKRMRGTLIILPKD
jgi:hypothetical protein